MESYLQKSELCLVSVEKKIRGRNHGSGFLLFNAEKRSVREFVFCLKESYDTPNNDS